jgi:hypothetical protein
MTNTFNIFVAVDWSAKSSPSPKKPSSDAIWVGIKDTLSNKQCENYFRTRLECKKFLLNLLKDYSNNNHANILVGYDLDFGFPRGLAKAMGYEGQDEWMYNWQFICKNVSDNENNVNNRFEVASKINSLVSSGKKSGPLWGCPKNKNLACLEEKSPQYPYITDSGIELRKKRWCEYKEPKAQPVWKLLGTASVGGQTLLGIPVINEIKNHELLKSFSRIWPFETGFKLPILQPNVCNIIHLEIWPGILTKHLDPAIIIKDQAQVRKTVDWLYEWTKSGNLEVLMSPPSWMTESMIEDAVKEEGWVIGAGLEGNIFAVTDNLISGKQLELF